MARTSNLPFDPCVGQSRHNVNWQQLYKQSSNLPLNLNCSEIFLIVSHDNLDVHKIYKVTNSGELAFVSENAFDVTGGSILTGGTVYDFNGTFFLVGFGEIWRSLDEGITWEVVFDFFIGIEPACMTVDAGGRIWLFCEADGTAGVDNNQGIFFSEDNGTSWSLTGPSVNFDAFSLSAHPTNPDIIAASGFEYGNFLGVHYTSNRGQTWATHILPCETGYTNFEVKNCKFLPSGRFLVVDQDLNNLGNGGSEEFAVKVFYTDDVVAGSFTMVLLEETSETDYFNPVIGMSGEGGKLIATAAQSHIDERDSVRMWQSDNEGETWVPITLWPQEKLFEDLSAHFYDADNGRLIIISTGALVPEGDSTGFSRVWISSPPGENWVNITDESDVNRMSPTFQMGIWRSSPR